MTEGTGAGPGKAPTQQEIDAQADALEAALARTPGDRSVLRLLLLFLDAYEPSDAVSGRHVACQRALAAATSRSDMFAALTRPKTARERLLAVRATLHEHGVSDAIRMMQLHAGGPHRIHGVASACDARMAMFKTVGAISALCFDCFKVQILTADIGRHFQAMGALGLLDLPDYAARKGMIETRAGVAAPYKCYIYCEAEEQAVRRRDAYLALLAARGIEGVLVAISHGCSEHGIAHPQFKYDARGAHRDFKAEPDWARAEARWFEKNPLPAEAAAPRRADRLSLRDAICLQSWVAYAQIIGDPAAELFEGVAECAAAKPFYALVSAQAEKRRAELLELEARQAASRPTS